MQVKVKICGITREKDVLNAIKAGADMIGFIVKTPNSPRNITVEKARRFIKLAQKDSETVVVSTSPNPKEINYLSNYLKPSAVQIYRNFKIEDENIKKFLVIPSSNESINRITNLCKDCDAIIVDTQLPGQFGGTGVPHDWRLTRKIRDSVYPIPIFVAGGLTPENVEQTVLVVNPFGVDVSSGVEKSPGIKDYHKMVNFVNKAKKVKFNAVKIFST